MKKISALIFSAVFAASALFAQVTTDDAGLRVPEDRIRTGNEGFASEEFRRGVQAYYKGAFNEAIVQFEKALAYLPDDNLILDWLGKAYYKAGLEGSALSYWNNASENGYGGLLLENKIEIVRERRVTGDSTDKLMRFSEAGAFPGEFQGNLVFSGPVAVQPNYDGTMWIAAYNTNELILLNQNGKVVNRIEGPLNGFDRPSDILRLHDGKLLVSEHAGDRLALLNSKGHFEKYIGKKGRGTGEMVGPLYLAQDYLERIYVTDYGNRRIDVFDKDGEPVFFFGGSSADFAGLKGPTGIAVTEERVFVADDQTGSIYEFDRAGNYIRELVEPGTFSKPESLKYWNGSLIVCDSNRVVSVDADSGALFEYVRTGNAPARVTSASPDVNGNVIVTDFTANEVYVMSKVQELVGGLFVQIEQIDASKFPNVTVELRVENRHRQPVVGLQEENFYLTENMRPVSKLKMLGAASSSLGDFSLAALKTKETSSAACDLALRLASNDLINAAKKRGIILITAGNSNGLTFEKYNLAELSSYMNNNSISFSVIQLDQAALGDELAYVSESTTGDVYYIYRPQGLGDLVKDVIELPQGIYQLSFTSAMSTNFGTNYLPLEAEVYLLNRSGRDETGYFAPLQ